MRAQSSSFAKSMPRAVTILAVLLMLHAVSGFNKLGAYDFFTDESTPLVFNGKMLMFESIVHASPQWAGYWLPAFENCSCYYRVRDLHSGVVIVNITETCNHAFGAAFVHVNETTGDEVLWIFGTHWIRLNSPVPPAAGAGAKAGWTAICPNNVCSVDAFWSSDPKLQEWSAALGAAPLPHGTAYNNDVTYIGAVTPEMAGTFGKRSGSGFPNFDWIMALEGNDVPFMIKNGSDLTSGWVPAYFTRPPIGQGDSCPSIRFDPEAGYFYYLSGGQVVQIARSIDLQTWEVGRPLLTPDEQDCMIAPIWYANYQPSPEAAALLKTCVSNPSGFGNDSDVDLTEWTMPNGTVATLFQYGAGNQATFGFANLALAPGPMFVVLSSFF